MWKRLSEEETNKWNGGDERKSLFKHEVLYTYGKNGKPFPRISLHIFAYPSVYFKRDANKAFRVSFNRKEDAESWWEDGELPIELIDELVDAIKEYKEKLV